MIIFSPAKLNLFLHITDRRFDGYHNLQSVFCCVDFGDFLTFKKANTDNAPLITLTGAKTLTDKVSDNLIVKAVQTLANNYPNYARPLCIHLDKHIPTGAGLGGGSSNCATTLLGVNHLWRLGLGIDELREIATTLGADVPFFVFARLCGANAIVESIGDCLNAIQLPPCEFLLLMPNAHISTAQFFAKNTLKRDCPIYSHDLLTQLDLYHLPPEFGNVFEPLAVEFSPNVATALSYLKQLQPQTQTTARMTGTGSVVFLPLIGIDQTTKAQFIKNAPCPAIITKLSSQYRAICLQ